MAELVIEKGRLTFGNAPKSKSERKREQSFSLEIDLKIASGQRVALVGPSGSGKTTVLECLSLLRPVDYAMRFTFTPAEGKVSEIASLWSNRSMSRLSALRAQYFGVASSQGGLFPAFTVRRFSLYRAGLAGMSMSIARNRIEELAARLEIGGLLDRPLQTMSRGQYVRGALLCALIHAPKVIVADEPTASLHPTLAGSVLELFCALDNDPDRSVVIATHDEETARKAGFTIVKGHTQETAQEQRTRFSL